MHAVDPFSIRPEIRLRSLAFNLVAQSVLAQIRFGYPVVIEREQTPAEKESRDQDRYGKPVDADPAGFERRNLVVLRQNAKRHQHRRQHAERREIVDQTRRQKEMVAEDLAHRWMILDDVAQQLEKRKYVVDENERHHQQDEVKQKTAQDVGVDHLRQKRNARGPYSWADAIQNARAMLRRPSDGPEQGDNAANEIAVPRDFQPRDHHDAKNEKHGVGNPHRDGRRQRALTRQADAARQANPVNKRDHHREHHSRRFSGSPRSDPQRNSGERQKNAGQRHGKTPVQFDPVVEQLLPLQRLVVIRLAVQRPGIHFGRR